MPLLPNAKTKKNAPSEVSQADFIPFASHYNPFTLLTKNGELMQVIRFSANQYGLDYESAEAPEESLRSRIRKIVLGNVTSKDYSFWLHTLRKRDAIQHAPDFAESYAAQVDKAWQDAHQFDYTFRNEVYLTILIQGESAELFDTKKLRHTFFPPLNRRHHSEHLDRQLEKITGTVGTLLKEFEPYFDARPLRLVQRETASGETAWHSELLEFIDFLLTLTVRGMPVEDTDISQQLSMHDLTFGFDALETRVSGGKKRFGAMLTLKGCPELSSVALDKCLQLPEEMAVTQTFNFIPAEQALEKAEEIKTMLGGEKASTALRFTRLDEFYESNHGRETDFAEQQISLLIMRDQYRQLDESVGRVQNAFSKLGMISVREDLRMEECFWAQLPGNFEFIRRKSSIPAKRIGSFARLNHFPTGSKENPWGKAVTILPTKLETPYFFNFHSEGVGHTCILDFNSFADNRGAALLNFLLCQSRQYKGRTFIFDRNHTARPLVKALDGRYHSLVGQTQESSLAAINPLTLEDTRRNRAFLSAWLHHFVRHGPEISEDSAREHIKTALEELMPLPPEQRTLEKALSIIASIAPELTPHLTENTRKLFGGTQDSMDFHGPVTAIDMEPLFAGKEIKELVIPVFSYLLHRLILSLDGTPAIIVLHEAWDLLNNDFFAPRIASLLEMLKSQNTLVIFTTRHFDDVSDVYLSTEILRNCPTRLFLPDDIAVDYFPEMTGLTKRELEELKKMERQKGEFLLKSGHEVVSCIFDLSLLESFRNVLAGDAKSLRLMQIQQR